MFTVKSEVGRLRQVILHRPDLELKRLTPDNAADLLFDDVLWVSRAQEEHDAFASALRERGVVVHYYADLLARTLDVREARDYLLARVRPAPARAARRRPAARGRGRAGLPDARALPGGRDHQARDRRAGAGAEEHHVPLAGPRRVRAGPAAQPALPAGHVLLDLRRSVDQRDAPPGAGQGVRARGGHLPVAPHVRRRRFRRLVPRRRRRPGHHRGRGRPGARQRRGTGRHERAHHAAGGGAAGTAAVRPRCGHMRWSRSTCPSGGRSCTWTRC